jgi:hypothetical protein
MNFPIGIHRMFFIHFGFLKLSYYRNATDGKVQYATHKYKRQRGSFPYRTTYLKKVLLLRH